MTTVDTTFPEPARLDALVATMRDALGRVQRPDGHWVFELEADATIPAEYILLNHFLGTPEDELEAKIGVYLRDGQNADGGWPLFSEGASDMSATVKCYYALKLIGDRPDDTHMTRARDWVLAHGGAARSNVFTRFTLALFGQVPWRAVPTMPVEIMLLPRWFPFHLEKVSYWSRTVIVPLLMLASLKPKARNPRGISVAELFPVPPDDVRGYITNPTGRGLGSLFIALDAVLRRCEPMFSRTMRGRAIKRAENFIKPRLNGEDGLGAIFPAMANVVMAYAALGYADDHDDFRNALAAVRKLVVVGEERAYCQPCLSPVWDTGLAAHAMLEAGVAPDSACMTACGDWLQQREVRDHGDWTARRPGLPPGGWAFQYENDHYPDVDDTAVVAMALHRADPARFKDVLDRAATWIVGMQSKNGGWGAFDADNTHHYLNNIPFADHGALLDPPTADVTARCVSMLCQLGYEPTDPAVSRGVTFLLDEQEDDGSWFGRWGANYVYGTWSVLSALNAAGQDPASAPIRRAVAWLNRRQNDDGGWGEDLASYEEAHRDKPCRSTPSQTAWAVLGLMAAGETESEAVRRGIAYLERAPRTHARWNEELYTGVGFPRVFYLKYHGYAAYFPLMAVARYRNLQRSNERRVRYGM